MKGKFLALVLFSITLFAGCSRKEVKPAISFDEAAENARTFLERAEAARTNAPAERMSNQDFFIQNFMAAYEKVGKKDPKWDDAARAYLRQLSTNSAYNVDSDPDEMRRLRDAAEKAGCEDPLVKYMTLRQRYNSRVANPGVTNQWMEAAMALEKSGYHPYWKLFSKFRAGTALRAIARKNKTKAPEVMALLNDCFAQAKTLLNDQSLPTKVMYQIIDELVIPDLKNRDYPKWAVENFEPLLISGWGDTAEAWYLIGEFHVEYAWRERGTGFANTVTKKGWQAMAEHLADARVALEKSWNLKPNEDAGALMLTVELGDSHGRAAMENWFNRVMWMNPESYRVCEAKLYWLNPKWYGSAEEMIAFGRQCVTNTAWRGAVPLILYKAHETLAEWYDYNQQEKQSDYWKRPEVWPDVKASFEKFFELNPLSQGWRHNYALAAYRARQWEDLRIQLKLLGPINYEYFGGKTVYEQMVKEAEINR